MRRVLVDANVLVSFFVDRIAKQRDAADQLLQKAEDGEIVAGEHLASTIRDVIAFPGVEVVDDCPWSRVFELWPAPLSVARRCRHRRDRTGKPLRGGCDVRPEARERLKAVGAATYW